MRVGHHMRRAAAGAGGGGTVYTAKTVILDITDSWVAGTVGLMGIEFLLAGVLQNTVSFVADVTTDLGVGFTADNPFVPGKTMVGAISGIVWLSGTSTNNRIYYQPLDGGFIEISFDTVRINNFHISGASTDTGIKNTKIWITPDIFANKVFEQAVPNGTLIFDGEIREHISSNVRDDDDLVLI